MTLERFVFVTFLIAMLFLLVACGGEDTPLEPSVPTMEYVVEGRATQRDNPSEGIEGVEISVSGLKPDGYSYTITQTFTDADGYFRVQFDGRVTDCPEAFPGSRPPGYHMTARKPYMEAPYFTALCGESPQTWEFTMYVPGECLLYCPPYL